MGHTFSQNSVVVAVKDQVSCNLGEESAILNLKSGVYYTLDPVGARVWGLLQQPRSIHEVRDMLLSEYDVERELCEQDLYALLEKLLGEGLIELRNGSVA
jgi:hypothetical protein